MRDEKTKKAFIEYLEENPELRFWQALGGFTRKRIYQSDQSLMVLERLTKEKILSYLEDTFYIEADKENNK